MAECRKQQGYRQSDFAERLGVSHTTLSNMTEAPGGEAGRPKTPSLAGHEIACAWTGATHVPCRVDGTSANVAVVDAIGCDDGRRRLPGPDVVDAGSHGDRRRFLLSLRGRGPGGVRIVASDTHAGLARAMAREAA